MIQDPGVPLTGLMTAYRGWKQTECGSGSPGHSEFLCKKAGPVRTIGNSSTSRRRVGHPHCPDTPRYNDPDRQHRLVGFSGIHLGVGLYHRCDLHPVETQTPARQTSKHGAFQRHAPGGKTTAGKKSNRKRTAFPRQAGSRKAAPSRQEEVTQNGNPCPGTASLDKNPSDAIWFR